MTVASQIQRLQAAEIDIRASIIGKGVDVPEEETIDTYPGYINQISGGGDSNAPVTRLIRFKAVNSTLILQKITPTYVCGKFEVISL